jgi:hypothetical protein
MPSARHLVHRPGTALHPAELTLADTVPAMAELIPLAEQSRAEAERAIDGLWTRYPHWYKASPRRHLNRGDADTSHGQ